MELLKGLILIALVALTSASLRQNRIVGGETAVSDQFSYQVSFRWERTQTHFCSGVILSNRWILSAHRFFHPKSMDEYYIVYGARRLSETGQTTKIAKLINHHESNVVLLFTKSEMIFIPDVVGPIALPTQVSQVDDVAIVSGWGITERVRRPHQNNFTDNIHFRITKLISIKECRTFLGPMASTIHDQKTICTKASSLDLGDEGNPLVSNTQQLIGVVSSIYTFKPNIPDIYTAVFPLVSWIEKYIYNYD